MATTLTVTELARRLPEALDHIHNTGESFVSARDDEPVAILAPLSSTAEGIAPETLAAALANLDWPDETFGDDLAAIQEAPPPAATLVAGH
jgi:antitoxin (DNA-binding transcriptional repressor) of toxin-antitoxin stability system